MKLYPGGDPVCSAWKLTEGGQPLSFVTWSRTSDRVASYCIASVTIFWGRNCVGREAWNGISCLVGAAIVVGIFGLFNWNGFLDLVHIQISQ